MSEWNEPQLPGEQEEAVSVEVSDSPPLPLISTCWVKDSSLLVCLLV